jgi:hypothetical protein
VQLERHVEYDTRGQSVAGAEWWSGPVLDAHHAAPRAAELLSALARRPCHWRPPHCLRPHDRQPLYAA